jgi:hypothetical protein
MLVLLAGAVSAYTLVMRDGRRVEIPEQFLVTGATLTYELSPGFQMTVALAVINIAATEKANGEPSGSFLKRGTKPPTEPAPAPVTPARQSRAQRTVTNRDLASYARTREESEAKYERRRKELGLPSVEESRQRNQAESQLIQQELEQRRRGEAESEAYWRARASELRTEMAAIDAEVVFIRTRLDDVGAQLNNSSFTVVSSAFPIGFGGIGHGGFRGDHRGQGFRNSRVFSAPRGATSLTGSIGFRGGPVRARPPIASINPGFPIGGGFAGPLQGGGFPNTRFNSFGFGSRGFAVAPPFLPFQNSTAFSSPFLAYDLGYERSALITQLDALVGRRAGLQARWRELEEEARRAGVPPGWLRP